MGLRIRKSVNFGPLRVNLSKSGVGYSVGTKGFRVTKKANGKMYTTASIPGSGISYVSDINKNKSIDYSKIMSITGKVLYYMFMIPLKIMFWSCIIMIFPIAWLIKLMNN